MMHTRLLVVAVAVCSVWQPALAQKNLSKAEKAEQEQKLKDYFLNRIVVAKITMPMTTAGVQAHWDKKKGQWVAYANEFDLRRWGVGVKAGEKYGITNVYLSRGGIVLWLNDGGSIDSSTKFQEGLKPLTGTLSQIKQNQEVQQKRTAANGSRVTIITYDLTDVKDLLQLAKDQTHQFFEIVEDSGPPNAAANAPGLQRGAISITSEPAGADIWVDESFMGQTPAKLTIAAGKRKIRLSLAGYGQWLREMEVGPGSELTLSATLTRP